MAYPGKGNKMSLYGNNNGNNNQTPYQQKNLWVEIVDRVSRIKQSHLAIKGDASGAFPGEKNGGKPVKPEETQEEITYFNNHKKHEHNSTYDRLFHVKHGYQSKIHRDDREHTRGLNVHEEESNKAVPALSSSAYGHRTPFDTSTRKHARIELVMKGFYRSRGTNLPEYGTEDDFNHHA